MLARKDHDSAEKKLPPEWTDEIKELLETIYAAQLEKHQKKIEIMGFSYSDEILLAISVLDKNNGDEFTPLTYLASSDLDQKLKPQKVLNSMVDSIGLFFDALFNCEEIIISEHITNIWEEVKIKSQVFYYKITRENIKLTIMANELLEK